MSTVPTTRSGGPDCARPPLIEPAPERARERSRSPTRGLNQRLPPRPPTARRPRPERQLHSGPGCSCAWAPTPQQPRRSKRTRRTGATAPARSYPFGTPPGPSPFRCFLPSSASATAPAPAAQAPECPRLPSRPQVSSSPFFLPLKERAPLNTHAGASVLQRF